MRVTIVLFLLHANITRYFCFLVTMCNFDTLVFHKGVNSIRADESSPLFLTRCLLSLVTNGNLTLLFFVEEKVVVIHRGRCNNKVHYRLSHEVVT